MDALLALNLKYGQICLDRYGYPYLKTNQRFVLYGKLHILEFQYLSIEHAHRDYDLRYHDVKNYIIF
jgi:hypothetical protein